MQNKLTVSIDKEVIEQAKLYAKKSGRSLSGMIENFLKVMLKKEEQSFEVSPAIKKLQGSVKLPQNIDYKTELQKALLKKYQL